MKLVRSCAIYCAGAAWHLRRWVYERNNEFFLSTSVMMIVVLCQSFLKVPRFPHGRGPIASRPIHPGQWGGDGSSQLIFPIVVPPLMALLPRNGGDKPAESHQWRDYDREDYRP